MQVCTGDNSMATPLQSIEVAQFMQAQTTRASFLACCELLHFQLVKNQTLTDAGMESCIKVWG